MSDEEYIKLKDMSLEEALRKGKTIDEDKEIKHTTTWLPQVIVSDINFIKKNSKMNFKNLIVALTKFGVSVLYEDIKEYKFNDIMMDIKELVMRLPDEDIRFYSEPDPFTFKANFDKSIKIHLFIYEDTMAIVNEIADNLYVKPSIVLRMALLYAITKSEEWIYKSHINLLGEELQEFKKSLRYVLLYNIRCSRDVRIKVSSFFLENFALYRKTLENLSNFDSTMLAKLNKDTYFARHFVKSSQYVEVHDILKKYVKIDVSICNMIAQYGGLDNKIIEDILFKIGTFKLLVKDYPELIEMVEKGEKDINKIFEGDGIND